MTRIAWVLLCGIGPGMLLGQLAHGAVLGPRLTAEVNTAGAAAEIPVIIRLADRVDVTRFRDLDRRIRRRRLVQALKARATQRQRRLRALLTAAGAKNLEQLWVINAVSATVPASQIAGLAALPEVSEIQLDAVITIPPPIPAPRTLALAGVTSRWNLTTIRVPELWAIGVTGNGIVVANMDTGVDVNHPDLAPSWRGGANSWFDPHGEHPAPADVHGHGTQSMGIMVAGDASGSTLGVAPGAQWIAVKIFDDAGQAPASAIHAGFQWLLDPDGDPATDDAPDIVNNSWGFRQNVNECLLDYQADIQVLQAAGIAVVFSAGNEGPGDSTSISPANNPEGFAVGAVDSGLNVGSFSSRGPSTCDNAIFPEVTAPGVSVMTTDLSFGGLALYTTTTGTSFASPHIAGVMALLLQAQPGLSIAQMESSLTRSAQDLDVPGPDNNYGYGLADAVEAYKLALCPSGGGDTDGDGILDSCDDCTLVANGPLQPDAGGNSQLDSDGDGYGNACDTDLTNGSDANDPVTNFLDLGMFRSAFAPGVTPPSNPDADFNGDGEVNFLDLGIFRSFFMQPPGPSGVAP